MGRKRTPGLYKRKDIWHIDKEVDGTRICESTGSCWLEEAEQYLARRIETIRQAKVYGIRPKRTFREAATKFLLENQQKKSIRSDATRLKALDPFIGDMLLEAIHMGSLQPFIEARQKEKVKNRTINHGLIVVRHILNLAASEWLDEHSLTWLLSAPKIKLLPEKDGRKPYPLTWEEEETFFAKLPLYLQRMALFKVNTGLRDQEVCKLKWEWEHFIPELNTSVFVIPGEFTKNGLDRLVILNKVAKKVVEEVRDKHSVYVFTCIRFGNQIIENTDSPISIKAKHRPLYQMNNNSWQKAREETGIPVRIHDLKHTFGRRLRAAGVSFEDRQDLLGHKSARITTHYSTAEVRNLLEAANKVCRELGSPALTLIRTSELLAPAKVPQGHLRVVEKSYANAM